MHHNDQKGSQPWKDSIGCKKTGRFSTFTIAVTRNRVKRRLRECFRPYLGGVKNGLYVVVARPSAAEATFQSLQRDVHYLLKKHNVLSPALHQEKVSPAQKAD